jgi:AcrR family transcriptional regulator
VPPPTRRGPAPSLDLEDVVSASLQLLDQLGAARFSIRTLAAELGVSPMTVYNYVPTKARLLEHVIDSVIDVIAPPVPDAPSWDEELRRYAREAWREQLPHPWLPALLAEHRIVDRPAQVASRNALLALFRAAGADDVAARDAVALFFSFMIGSFVQIEPTLAGHRPIARANALFEGGLDMVIEGMTSRFRPHV